MNRTPRPRKCRTCRTEYTPARMGQKACSPRCAVQQARDTARRQAARDKQAARVRLRTRRDWAKIAQQKFNAWVRLRDADLPCVSCGRFHDGQWHAGHYLTTGARPELRYEPLNCHRQCQPCNTHLSGNLVLYRQELLKRIGKDAVAWLEGPHAPKKYSSQDLADIAAHYSREARKLKRARESNAIEAPA